MQAWAYATFGRGANLTGGPLSQSKVQQQPLACWLIVVKANVSSLSTERLANHGRDKNKEQTLSIDCRDDGKRRRPVVKQLTVCASTQLPCWLPEGRKGSETLSRLAIHAWPAHKSPSLLFDQDLVINFATYTWVYMVIVCMLFVYSASDMWEWDSVHVWQRSLRGNGLAVWRWQWLPWHVRRDRLWSFISVGSQLPELWV